MRQATVIRIVVASPSDVQGERNIVSEVVDELNQSLAAAYDLHISVSRWETDAHPGFHPEGPQGLIDNILKVNECDILICVFWKRFGTPVMDAQSGTEHEFKIAYESWRKSKQPQIMLYFNTKPYSPSSKEETDQWGQVLDFKKNVPSEGLWWTYNGEKEFEKVLRKHLTLYIANLTSKKLLPQAPDLNNQDDNVDLHTISTKIIELHKLVLQQPMPDDTSKSLKFEEQVYDARINTARDLILDGKIETAQSLLLNLRNEIQDLSLSAELQCRIATNLAACAYQLDDIDQAKKEMWLAFDLQPDNPKSLSNAALAATLDKDLNKALDLITKSRNLDAKASYSASLHLEILHKSLKEEEFNSLLGFAQKVA